MLTKAMALDYAKRGVRVNAICCGEIETPLFVREAAHYGIPVEEYGKNGGRYASDRSNRPAGRGRSGGRLSLQ